MRLTLVTILCCLTGCAAPNFMRGDSVSEQPPSPQAREVVLHAMAQLGVRYRYGGASPASGFDCSGLVQYVFSQATGLALPRTTFDIARVGDRVGRRQLQPGDLVFFNTQRQPYSHVGIYLGNQRFIHAPSEGGRVEVVTLANRYWDSRFNGARRLAL